MDISWGKRRPVRRSDNLATFVYQVCKYFGSWNFLDPYVPVQACKGLVLQTGEYQMVSCLVQLKYSAHSEWLRV